MPQPCLSNLYRITCTHLQSSQIKSLAINVFPSSFPRCSRLQKPLSVAPMIDVTNQHFHRLCRFISPNYTLYSELIHVNALLNNPHKVDTIIGPPHPDTVVQLGGCDPQAVAKAAKIVQEVGFENINLNVGCPSDRVQAGSFGAVLMKTPEKVAAILDAVGAIGVKIPVSIKCRIGIDKLDSYEFLYDFVKCITTSSFPPAHIIIHARKAWLKGLSPRKNRSVPPLNYDRVWTLAKDFPDLVISVNGGFDDVEKVKVGLENVDGVMIGRSVMDNPMFLQTLDQTFYPSTPEISQTQILSRYLQYATVIQSSWSKDTRSSPLSILLRPVMMLYQGRTGRRWRKQLGETIQLGKKEGWDVEKVGVMAWEKMEADEMKYEVEKQGSEAAAYA